MKSINNNQKGFSAVEGLLLLVVVAIIAFTGWFVWQSRNKANSTLKAASKSASSTVTVTKKATAKLAATPYTDPDTGLVLYYPDGWVKKDVAGTLVAFANPVADKDAKGNSFAASLSLTAEETTQSQSDYLASAKVQLAKALTNYKEVTSRTVTVSDGSKLNVIEYTFDSGALHLHNVQAIGVQEGVAAVFTGSALASHWGTYSTVFEQSIVK